MPDSSFWAIVSVAVIIGTAGASAVVGTVALAFRRLDAGQARERATWQVERTRLEAQVVSFVGEGNSLHYALQEMDRLTAAVKAADSRYVEALTRFYAREDALVQMVREANNMNRQATVVTGHAVDVTAQAQALAAQAVAAKPAEGA